MEGATSNEIAEQIKNCPSGALGFHYNENKGAMQNTSVKINVLDNGPILIEGSCVITEKGADKNSGENGIMQMWGLRQ